LTPAASAGAGGATTGGSTAAATAPSAKVFEDGAAMTGQGRKKRRAFDWRTFNEEEF